MGTSEELRSDTERFRSAQRIPFNPVTAILRSRLTARSQAAGREAKDLLQRGSAAAAARIWDAIADASRALDDETTLAAALFLTASSLFEAKQHQRAAETARAAARAMQAVGDASGLADALHVECKAEMSQGHVEEAVAAAQRAYDVARSAGLREKAEILRELPQYAEITAGLFRAQRRGY